MFYFILYLDNEFGVFFFSSRRRHTRWTGDWSSDVCSSDLRPGGHLRQPRRGDHGRPGRREGDRDRGQPARGRRPGPRDPGKRGRVAVAHGKSDDEAVRTTHNTARFFTETRHVSWVLLIFTVAWGS